MKHAPAENFQNSIMGFASPASSVTAQLWLPLSPCCGASLAAGSSAGGKVALGCTQPLPLVAVLLTCHPSVSAADSLKHSTVPTTVSHRELARLSEGDESSPAPTAATLRPPNSALKIAAHKATEAGSLLLHPVLTQWDDLHPTAVFTRKE